MPLHHTLFYSSNKKANNSSIRDCIIIVEKSSKYLQAYIVKE